MITGQVPYDADERAERIAEAQAERAAGRSVCPECGCVGGLHRALCPANEEE